MKNTIYLVASGDLRISANQQCQEDQAALEKDLTAAIKKEGHMGIFFCFCDT